ncbi:MAG: hypothetical protein AAF226_03565 [Verrucomicrobiota bacterium]
MLIAAKYSKDKFSRDYYQKWGAIEIEMQRMSLADKNKSQQGPAPVDKDGNPYTAEATRDPDAPNSADGTATDDNSDEWGEFTLEDLKKMVPQSDAGDFLLEVPQIFFTAGDQELMKVMEGIPIETKAQLIAEENPETFEGENKLRAFRIFVECCAADARPLSIALDFPDGLPEYQELGWYILKGNLRYAEEDSGEFIPEMSIRIVEPTSEPMDTMLY